MRYYFLFFLFILFAKIGFSQKTEIDSLLIEYNNAKEDTLKIILLLEIGNKYLNSKPNLSIYYDSIAKVKSKSLLDKTDAKQKEYFKYLYSKALYEFGYVNAQTMKYEIAEKDFLIAIENLDNVISKTTDSTLINKSNYLKSDILYAIAGIYYDKGYFSLALEYYVKANKIIDKLISVGFVDSNKIAGQYFMLGLIHFELKNYDKALENYEKSLEISKKNNYEKGIAKCNNNIGVLKLKEGKEEEAIIYFDKVLDFAFKNNNLLLEAQAYDNLGECLILKKDFDNAELYLAKALVIAKKIRSKQGESYINLTLAKLYLETKKYNKAIYFNKKAIELAKQIGSISLEKDAYKQMFLIYSEKGKYKDALKYHIKFKELTDTIFNKEKNRQIAETEAKYESNKKQLEIERQKLELAQKDARIKRKTLQTIALTTLSVLLILFIVFIYFTIRSKQKSTKYIQEQNKKITDSIEYAQKIQTAALPSEKLLYEIFEESFIFNKPLQIVSGDFYWAYKKEHFTAFALADCTGHGIPGAFISIFGISLLNELILNFDLTRPDVILEEMRFHLKKSLSQTGKLEEQTDGIDIALCIINNKTNELFYAGANQSAYLMQNGKIEELMPVMNPVGIYPKEIPFKMHKRKLESGDLIYLFSDGFVDQFGGDKKKPKKYTVNRFNKLLKKIYNLSLNEQKNILEKEFNTWMNTNNQLDDVLVFGIKY